MSEAGQRLEWRLAAEHRTLTRALRTLVRRAPIVCDEATQVRDALVVMRREGIGCIVVVDARSRQAYAREHIPGAINIPHREMSRDTTTPVDRTALVVTYCDGIGCNASTKGALKMAELGFRTKELIGGLDWWKRDPDEVLQTCKERLVKC